MTCGAVGCDHTARFAAYAGGAVAASPFYFCATHLAGFYGAPEPWGSSAPIGARTLVVRVA